MLLVVIGKKRFVYYNRVSIFEKALSANIKSDYFPTFRASQVDVGKEVENGFLFCRNPSKTRQNSESENRNIVKTMSDNLKSDYFPTFRVFKGRPRESKNKIRQKSVIKNG